MRKQVTVPAKPEYAVWHTYCDKCGRDVTNRTMGLCCMCHAVYCFACTDAMQDVDKCSRCSPEQLALWRQMDNLRREYRREISVLNKQGDALRKESQA